MRLFFATLAALTLAGPASLYGQEAEPPVSVTLDASAAVPLSDFPTVALGSVKGEGAEVSWFVTPEPEGGIGTAPLTEGRFLLILIKPKPGKYAVTLIGQVPREGKDPVASASGTVIVGETPDPVIPPGPKPVPTPNNLTGLAKAVYEAARGVDKAVLRQAAEAYGSQVSAIGAGAYAGVTVDQAKEQIVNAILDANPPRNKAPAVFDAIDNGLTALEDAGKFNSLAEVQVALADVTAGLEAAAR